MTKNEKTKINSVVSFGSTDSINYSFHCKGTRENYDDVIAENIYTTNMDDFIKVSGFRNSVYKKQFPTGTWLEVKGLAIKGQLNEIDMEAHKSK